MEENRFSTYTYGEGRTGINQLIEFTCRPEDKEKVQGFLRENIRHIGIPTTGRVNIPHGGYGRYTRYEVTQHDYAGGGGPGNGGYIEVLEIKNPPDGRWGIVINESLSSRGNSFTEFETLEHAREAFTNNWSNSKANFSKLPGFKRQVKCGALTPWFYAIGDEELLGDFAFPEGLQDDPVYRFGSQFVVFDEDGSPQAVKTCMGTRFVRRKRDYHPYDEYQYRLVYFDDGSVWDESGRQTSSPRPIKESEAWIADAVEQFRQLLSGKKTGIEIKLLNGTRFVGRVAAAPSAKHCAEGTYFLKVQVKGEKKAREGWVDFKPTEESPNVVEFAKRKLQENGKEVERIEVTSSKTKKGGRKWHGAYVQSPF